MKLWKKILDWKILSQEVTNKAKLLLPIEKYDGEVWAEKTVQDFAEYVVGKGWMFSLGYFPKTRGLFQRDTYANLTANSAALKGGSWSNNPEVSPRHFGLFSPLTCHSALLRAHKTHQKITGRAATKSEALIILEMSRRTPSAQGVVEIGGRCPTQPKGKSYNANNPKDRAEVETLISVMRDKETQDFHDGTL